MNDLMSGMTPDTYYEPPEERKRECPDYAGHDCSLCEFCGACAIQNTRAEEDAGDCAQHERAEAF